MADLVAARGPWFPRVAFDVDARGRRFAYRPGEIVFLGTNDQLDELLSQVEALFQLEGLWDEDELAADVQDARDRFGDSVESCDVYPDGSLGPGLPLIGDPDDGDGEDNFDHVNGSNVVKITLTERILDGTPYAGWSLPAIVRELQRVAQAGALAFTPSLNPVYFAAAAGVGPVMASGLSGAPVTWSGVGGAPVTWSGVGGAPVTWSGIFGAPVTWSGVGGAPVTWSGVGGAPVTWSGVGGAPVTWSSGAGSGHCGCCCDDDRDWSEPSEGDPLYTSARAALDPGYAKRRGQPLDELPVVEGTCRVVVLDTGFGGPFAPAGVDNVGTIPGLDNDDQVDDDNADGTGDNVVDPAAGHGTFIASLIRRLAPEATIEVGRVLSSFGDGSDCVIATVIRHLAIQPVPGVLNLSFVAYTPDDEPPPVLASAIAEIQDAGWIVVAAAGNDATCRPAYPAALPGVVGVGALAPWGPAWFSNHGEWVRACAPGFDIISNWFDFTGAPAGLMRTATAPAGHARGWAAWSGTSFAAPIVTAALARDVISAGWPPNDVEQLRAARQAIVEDTTRSIDDMTTDLLALDAAGPNAVGGDDRAMKIVQLRQAVERVIDDPRLARVPCLGTIVNDHL